MDSRRWKEIQAAFDELVALDEASRASRLAALGATDRALRQAVEVLLAADGEADQRLAPLEAAFFPPATPAPDPLSLAGRTVSHFRVVERLQAMAARVGVPAVRLAMAWVFQNPAVTTVLVGARTIGHLDNAVAALKMNFPPEWLAEMNTWE